MAKIFYQEDCNLSLLGWSDHRNHRYWRQGQL